MKKWDVERLKEQGYKSGSIVSVRVQNFLTYDECEVFPGPKLNIVIGPNGTGKSALTHAICLACCGSTSDVGRATDLSKFVKQGKEGEESFVEVDLLNKDTVTNIRRTISSESRSSKWTMNYKPCAQKDVKDLMVKLSIDVDNLCSFMPQDKVGMFTQFKPKDMLQNTLKSVNITTVSQRNLYDEQMELNNLERAKDTIRRQLEAKRKDLVQKTVEYESLSSEVEKLRRRDDAKKILKFCEIKYIKLELEECEDNKKTAQEALDAASNRCSTEAAKVAPLEGKERDLRRQKATKDKACEGIAAKSDKIEASIKQHREATDLIEVEVTSASIALDNVLRQRQHDENLLHTAKEDLKKAEDTLELARRAIPLSEQRMKEVKSLLRSATDEEQQMQEDIRRNNNERQDLQRQIATQRHKLGELKDSRQLYKKHLNDFRGPEWAMKMVRNTLDYMERLDSQQQEWLDRRQLRGNVYGPVAAYCEISDPAVAVMFEQQVPLPKLLGFLVENDEDARFLRGQFPQADIYTMKNVHNNHGGPYSRDNYELLLRELNLKGYLNDCLKCPDIIRSFLCAFAHVDKVLWGRHTTGATNGPHRNLTSEKFISEHTHLLTRDGQKTIKVFVQEVPSGGSGSSSMRSPNAATGGGDIMEYMGKVSQYAGPDAKPSLKISPITPKRVLNYDMANADSSESVQAQRQQLETTLTALDKQALSLTTENRTLEGQLRAKAVEIGKLKQEIAQISAAQKKPQELELTVQRRRRDVAEKEKKLSVDSESVRRDRQRDYQHELDRMLASIEATVKACREYDEFFVDKTLLQTQRSELAEAISVVAEQIQSRKADLVQFRREESEARRARDLAIEALRECEQRMIALANEHGGMDKFQDDVFLEAYEAIVENTKEELEDRMNICKAAINASVDNPRLTERHRRVGIEKEELEREIAVVRASYDNAGNDLEQRAVEWLTAVKGITATLDSKFREYMKELDVPAAVVLRETGTFENYELQLRVSFRKDSQLVDLDAHVQSGGERAISTVMFLMALQDMASSPFRVVDEINQGMDELNERLAIDRVVTSCCGDPQKPQYFFVTPKLLQALRAMDNPDVTCLIVFNGPGVKSKFTFAQLLVREMEARGISMPNAAAAVASSGGVPRIKKDPGATAGAASDVSEGEQSESDSVAAAPKKRKSTAAASGAGGRIKKKKRSVQVSDNEYDE